MIRVNGVLTVTALILLADTSGDVRASEAWPRFRGENGEGFSSARGLPVRWSEPEIRWKTVLPGRGHSSPVTWGESVFVTSGNDTNADRYITCVRQTDGSIAWQKRFASEKFSQNRDNSFGSTTPAVDSAGIYLYWTTPKAITVQALGLDGKENWTKQLGPFVGRHGSGASPVLCGGLIWVNNDQDGPSSLIALEPRSGAVKYTIPRRADKASYGTPCVWKSRSGEEQIIFAASSYGLTSLNPQNGAINWDYTNLFSTRVVSSPIASDGLIICSSGEGGVGRRLVVVRPPAGSNAPELVYEQKSGVPNVPTPLAKDGRLYLLCDNGLLRCLRTVTGELIWQERLPARFYASPVLAEGRLYLTSRAGDVFVVAAADKYELLAQNSLGEGTSATPAIANDTLFFRTESSLLGVAQGTPAVSAGKTK